MSGKESFRSFLVGLYLFSVPVFSYSEDLGLNALPQIIGVLVMIYAIYTVVTLGTIEKNIPIILYFLFSIWSLITFTLSGRTEHTSFLFTLIKVSSITISSAVLIRTKQDFMVCIKFFFMSIFFTFWLNYESITGFSAIEEDGDVERFAGTLSNANTAALYSITIIWAGIIILLSNKRLIILPFLILGIIVSFFILIYSGSRKGIVSIFVFAILLLPILISKFGRSSTVKIMVLLSYIVGFYYLTKYIADSPFYDRVRALIAGGDASIDIRRNLVLDAINVWSSSLKNTLLGVGIGNFRNFTTFHGYSHSSISETLVATGLIGFVLYLSSFASLFILSYKVFREVSQNEKIHVLLILPFFLLFFLFNIGAVLIDDRLLWPLTGVISNHLINLRKKPFHRNIYEEEINIC